MLGWGLRCRIQSLKFIVFLREARNQLFLMVISVLTNQIGFRPWNSGFKGLLSLGEDLGFRLSMV